MATNTNGFAFTRGANEDNTWKVVTEDMQSVAYAATVDLLPSANKNYYQFAALSGDMTITANEALSLSGSGPKWGDTMELQFAASGANRTVTFSTGLVCSATTLVVVSAKFGNITFTFTANGWIETNRTLTA